jgi:hypothetical protein
MLFEPVVMRLKFAIYHISANFSGVQQPQETY